MAGDIDSANMFSAEFLNSLSLLVLPGHKLKLKVDMVVILLRKMDINAGHCNGTRSSVKMIGLYRIILHKLDARDDDENKVVILSRIVLIWGGKLPV